MPLHRGRWLLNLYRCLVQGIRPVPELEMKSERSYFRERGRYSGERSFRQRRPVLLTTGGLISVSRHSLALAKEKKVVEALRECALLPLLANQLPDTSIE